MNIFSMNPQMQCKGTAVSAEDITSTMVSAICIANEHCRNIIIVHSLANPSKMLKLYIYIYKCVCVCVCACMHINYIIIFEENNTFILQTYQIENKNMCF